MDTILESLFGKVHFVLMVGDKAAVEIEIKDKEILLLIKNPLYAIELGLEEFLKSRKGNERMQLFETLKKMGYKIKIKYGLLEFSL